MNQTQVQNFAKFLEEKGYSKQNIHVYSKALEQAPDDWNTSVSIELYEHITETLATAEFLVAARHYIKPASKLFFLMVTGITLKEYSKQFKHYSSHENNAILDEFYEYSTEFKSLTVMSARAECQHVSAFLDYIRDVSFTSLSELRATELRDYVCNKLSKLKPSSKGRYITSLRNFFRFLEYKGIQVSQSVLELPLAPAEWNKGKVPIILTEDEEIRLRNHYSGNTTKAKRNRVIILLMLELGMRCSEVTGLKLSDFHWNCGTIKLSKTKTKRVRELPIPDNLGHMIEDYIISSRPRTLDEHLFQRKGFNNQYEAMNRENVRSVVRYAFRKENINGWWKGTHALRRTAASHLFNAGNDLKLTADLLGHESLDSTTQYVKVDFESLRKVASRWPGGDSND